MIEGLIIAAIMLCILIIIAHWIVFYKNKKQNIVSFRETFDLTNLPIITFYQGHHKLNFLLDSGSDMCHINKAILPCLIYKVQEDKRNLSGVGEGSQICNVVNMDISYHGVHFNSNFLASDLTDTFEMIKQDTGIQLHGILGCQFFDDYKYIIDFREMIFYSKK